MGQWANFSHLAYQAGWFFFFPIKSFYSEKKQPEANCYCLNRVQVFSLLQDKERKNTKQNNDQYSSQITSLLQVWKHQLVSQPLGRFQAAFQTSGLCVAHTRFPRLTQLHSYGSRRCLFWFWQVSSPEQWGTLKALSWSTVLQGTIRGSRNSSSFMMRRKDPCTGSFHLHSPIPILALEGLIFTSVSRQINELNLIFKVCALKPIILQLTM